MIWTNDSTLASMKLTDKEFTPILYDVKIHNIKNPSNQKKNINQEMKKNQLMAFCNRIHQMPECRNLTPDEKNWWALF